MQTFCHHRQLLLVFVTLRFESSAVSCAGRLLFIRRIMCIRISAGATRYGIHFKYVTLTPRNGNLK